MTNRFQSRSVKVDNNPRVRTPQREAFFALEQYAAGESASEREIGVVLPVGCGKSGCIALTPFAFRAKRALVVAPNVTIARQLCGDFDPANQDMFYVKSETLSDAPFPEPVEIRGKTTNISDLQVADVVITNIQQLQGEENRWLDSLPDDFFDLILFDEGHHNVAASWNTLRNKFTQARIVNFSATPLRADGQLMAGHILYSYPVFRAIQEGYVKRLKAVVLNPRTLRYVRNQDGVELNVELPEVRRLGEEDPDFRRSIVTSSETLNTIVDASIRELQKLRKSTGEMRLKIIAAVLNYEHCSQVVAAYRARGLRADYVHSREDGASNKKVHQRLENHEIDVIVQVRKLGEGFDHQYLSVAAVFSVFNNLSPFIQFVGRIMRVIKQNAPGDELNSGVVVFHAGANIARRWEDFQNYSEADQEYFDQLLPMEGLDFSSADELQLEPVPETEPRVNPVVVQAQTGVLVEEIPLIKNDLEALEALRLLKDRGYSVDQLREAFDELKPVPVTMVRQRQAMRAELDMRIRTEAAKSLHSLGLNPEGKDLDRQRLGRGNLIVLMSAINMRVNSAVGHKSGERHEFTKLELEAIYRDFSAIVEAALTDVRQ